jgi:UDP-2-acetamido-3-amino-2,3-dideoxy-glucuronate N-acetyltransferase
MSVHPTAHIAPTAYVDPDATVGAFTSVWDGARLGPGTVVATDCVIARNAELVNARVGNRVKIQTGCGVFGAVVEDGALLAPGVYLLEDPYPRATRPDGQLKRAADWARDPVTIRAGASVGAGAVVAPGTTVGRCAMVMVGAVVHRDVPGHAQVGGNPARHVGWVCTCGRPLTDLLCLRCAVAYRLGDDGVLTVAA